MPKSLASLSLDLDNCWSYLKTHGDAAWRDYPSYLDLVVPRVLRILDQLALKITFFVVGKDADMPRHRSVLSAIANAGHEIGNHSYHHEPWLHRYSEAEVEDEIERAEVSLTRATGARPVGFRGPGYSLSPTVLRVLARCGYHYDASTFPTFLGPVARRYYFLMARLSQEEKRERARLFGGLSEGLRPVRPYRWTLPEGSLLEIPVTTLPWLKLPMHLSHVLFLASKSRAAARAYWRLALAACRLAGVAPSMLLHPLDFLGKEDVDCLAFFPAMSMTAKAKLDLAFEGLGTLGDQFAVVPMGIHATRALQDAALPALKPHFPEWTEDQMPRLSQDCVTLPFPRLPESQSIRYAE